MRFEDFVRATLSEREITVKDAALMLGYTEPSFRNKLSKGNLNMRDVIILGILLGLKLSLYDDFGECAYSFESKDYLSDEDLIRLETFIQLHMDETKYLEWFKSLPNVVKEYIYKDFRSDIEKDEGKSKFKNLSASLKKERRKTSPEKDGFTVLDGKLKRYFIFGSDHQKAYEYIINQRSIMADESILSEEEDDKLIKEASNLYDIKVESEFLPLQFSGKLTEL